MTFDDIRKQIRESLIVEQLERRIFAGLISPPPQQVLQEYQKRSQEFARPEARDISLIVITDASYKDDRNKARRAGEKILGRLARTDFATVARETSEDEHAKEGGRQGFMRRDELSETIAVKAFSLPKGGMSGLVRMPAGYFIVQCHDIKPAGIAPFEEVQSQLSQEMVVRMRLARRDEALKKIRDTAFIRRLSGEDYLVYRKGATTEDAREDMR